MLIPSGRVASSRIASSKLVFLDLIQDGRKVQAMCNLRTLKSRGVSEQQFKQFRHISQEGHVFCKFVSLLEHSY